MRSASCNARHGPCTCFLFSDFQTVLQTCLVDKMVNPLPIRNLNWQTFKQKVQELFQPLLNNPLRVLVTLVIARGLWIPFIKYTFLYGSFGFIVLLRALCYPIEFLVKKLPLRYRRILWPYLTETLEIFLRPLQISVDLFFFAFKLLLFGEVRQIRSLGLSAWRIRRSNFFKGMLSTSGRILPGTSVPISASGTLTSL